MGDNKNILLILLVLSFLLSLLTIFVVAEGGIPTVSARSSVLYEPVSGTFVLEKDADTRLPMASTTKIMTALIAIERLDLDQTVRIPKEATGIEGSSVYLKENDEITVRDLIYSVLLQSANDAATALAILTSGDIKSFADEMNARAGEIGLTNTNFENPHGLDSENHFTTARDLAILAAVALKNDTFKEICSTHKYSFNISGLTRTVVNHNKMLKRYDGATGVKTGYTDKSGRCLVSAAERDGITMIAVTLNAPNDWDDHARLLDFGFDGYEAIELSAITATEYKIPVMGGKLDVVTVSISDINRAIPKKKGSTNLHTKTDIPSSLTAPITAGDTVGKITVYDGDKPLISYSLTAIESIEEEKYKVNIYDFLKDIF